MFKSSSCIQLLTALSIMLTCLTQVQADHGVPGDPDTSCGGGPITLELGQGLPLPRQYSGSNSKDSVITGTMLENSIFGSERVVFIKAIPEDLGVSLSAHPVIPTSPSTPLGSDDVIVEFTSDVTGATVLATCNYQVTVVLPENLRNLIQLPVRWCAVEGSEQAEDKSGPVDSNNDGILEYETVEGKNLLSLLQRMSDQIWVPGAQISFRSAFADNGIPVIADSLSSGGNLGDLAITGGGFGEWRGATQRCLEAWSTLYAEQRGIIVVNAKRIIGTGTVVGGVAPAVPRNLMTLQDSQILGSQAGTGERGDDLCGSPRSLTVGDITPLLQTAVYDQTLFGGSTYGLDSFEPSIVLAHELGHTLSLGHGNGLDDNGDGVQPPDAGSRRYDDYCDFIGTTEDPGNAFVSCSESSSLMLAQGCIEIRPLQKEMVRAAAKLVPGASFDAAFDPAATLVSSGRGCAAPCDLPPDVFLVQAEMAETPSGVWASYTHTLLGPGTTTATREYLFYSDLDNNPATGCDPFSLSLPGGFAGAELVTRVSIEQIAGVQSVTPTVWQCVGSTLVPSSDSDIRASAYTQGSTDEPTAELFKVVTLQMPTGVRGPANSVVRLKAIARELGGAADELPLLGSGIVSLIPPQLPECQVEPPIAQPGGVVTVSAAGLGENRTVELLLGGKSRGAGTTNATGNVDLELTVPATSLAQVRPVSINSGAATADCFVLVTGDALTPATVATISPKPSGPGWNNTDVQILLTATPVPGGASIDKISQSTSGAQAGGPIETSGETATVSIISDGSTTVSYFSIDLDGIKEETQNLLVKIDRTNPVISASTLPVANVSGWNNTDVVVSFSCDDDASGVGFCTSQVTLESEGMNQSVEGIAEDFAGNIEMVLVTGINIDKTPPIVSYTGNAGAYGILDMINIVCNASDILSGVAVDTCEDITGPAFDFDPGTNSFSANATDYADNGTMGSTSFDVFATFDDLCTLTQMFIFGTNPDQRTNHRLGNSHCAKLANAQRFDTKGKIKQKNHAIAVYVKQVGSNTPRFFTENQELILTTWAASL